MCTIQAQSSLACSVNLRVKSGQRPNAGRRLRERGERKRMRETVQCFILHLLPAFISLRRRGVERMTPFSSLPRSRGKTPTCRKRRSYNASQKIQKTWIQQTLKPQMSMDHIRLSSASCGCTDFVSAASGKHSPQKCIKSRKNSCKVVFFVSYDLRTLVCTFNKLLWLSAKNAIQGVESFVR